MADKDLESFAFFRGSQSELDGGLLVSRESLPVNGVHKVEGLAGKILGVRLEHKPHSAERVHVDADTLKDLLLALSV